MEKEVEKILLNVINDFNSKWTSHSEKDEGVSEYAEKIVKLFCQPAVIKSLPDSDEIRMKARELDEKDFAQWMYEIQKGNVL